MKAIVFTEYGSPDVLHLTEIEKPIPKDNDVLIKIHAVNVNYGDTIARNFKTVTPRKFNMPSFLWLPARLAFGFRKPRKAIQILGNEFAGEIEAIGAKVTRFMVGDRVFGYRGPSFGATAEYLLMRETGVLALKPTNMNDEEASTIPYGAVVALKILKKVNLQRGQKVLINGASGGIGSYAVQITKSLGAEVTGVCGTPRMDFVKAIGADKVIDYTQADFTKNGEAYDLIFDVLGKSSFAQVKNSLKENGCLLLASFKIPHILQGLRTAFVGNKRVICAMVEAKPQDLLEVKEMIEAGKIKTVIDRCYPLEQTAEAHRYSESGEKKGPVVITVIPSH